jgi:hypothetical protein
MPMLFAAGYLVRDGDALVIAHVALAAGELDPSSTSTRTRVASESASSSDRVEHESGTSKGPSARNDSPGSAQSRGDQERKGEEKKGEGSHISSVPSPPPVQSTLFGLPPPDAKLTIEGKVSAVLEHWRAAAYHQRTPKDTPERRVRIRRRLDEGFSVEEIQAAIDGAGLDPWLMGTDPKSNGTKYLGIETILREAKQVERLRDLELARRAKSNGRVDAAAPTVDEDLAGFMPDHEVTHDEMMLALIATGGDNDGAELVAPRRAPAPPMGAHQPAVMDFNFGPRAGSAQ